MNRQSVNGYLMPFLTLPMPAVIYQPMGFQSCARSQVNQGKIPVGIETNCDDLAAGKGR